jgi:hypothetical protein
MKENNIIKKPFIFIVGIEKCGTTSLFDLLNSDRRINGASLKEPCFFSSPENLINEYFLWYKSLFKKNKSLFNLEASTSYCMSKRAPKLIKKYINDPKIIFILRDPAKRIYSAILHMKKQLPPAEKRDIQSIVKPFENKHKFKVINRIESNELKEAIKKQQIIAHFLNKDFISNSQNINVPLVLEDYLWNYRYFTQSFYSKYIDYYKKYFGRNKLKVIFLEELIQQRDKVLKELVHFIMIPNLSKLRLPQNNKTLITKNKYFNCLLSILNKQLNPEIKSILKNVGVNKLVKRLFLKTPKPISKDLYEKIRFTMRDEYAFWFNKKPNLKKMWKY